MKEEITIGRRGSITLPARPRKQYGLREQDKMIIEETDEGLLLRPAVSIPIELYSEKRIAEFEEDDEKLGTMLDGIDKKNHASE